MRNRFRGWAVAGVLALTVAACGGDTGGDTTTVTAADEVTTTTAASPDETVATVDPGDGAGGFSTVCLEATQAMAAAVNSYSTGLAGAMGGSLDAEALEETAGQLQAMADAAPDEIKDDLQVIAEELGVFYAALAEVGIEPGVIPSQEQAEQLANLAESIDQEAFDEASENIEAWFDANC